MRLSVFLVLLPLALALSVWALSADGVEGIEASSHGYLFFVFYAAFTLAIGTGLASIPYLVQRYSRPLPRAPHRKANRTAISARG
ncbi:hypothetical protein ACLBXM_08750 [Xanthobacteraceae bacterium A53D]